MCWIYKYNPKTNKYEVGYFIVDGTFFIIYSLNTAEEAEETCHYLNGGN